MDVCGQALKFSVFLRAQFMNGFFICFEGDHHFGDLIATS